MNNDEFLARASRAAALFTVGEEVNHRIGDPECPECWG